MSDTYIPPHLAQGFAHHQAGRLAQAEQIYRQTLAVDPCDAVALHLLGLLAMQVGKLDAALRLLARSLELRPGQAFVLADLASTLHRMGRLDEAIAAVRQAIARSPGVAALHLHLGNLHRDAGRYQEAMAAYRQAIALGPIEPAAHNNLANALKELGELDEAETEYRAAMGLAPRLAEPHNNLGILLQNRGRVAAAVAEFRRATALDPNFAMAHSNLLFALHLDESVRPEQMLRAHQEWDTIHGARVVRAAEHGNPRDPDRTLRIGYVSSDFGEHPVGRFLLPLLEGRDRAAFHVTCYSNAAFDDALTPQFRAAADDWRDITHIPDAQAAQQIREARIDILIDLCGHTGRNRLLIFAHKPVPVQITMLGYPDTTGLTAIDYRMTDPFSDPPSRADGQYSEKLCRLPSGIHCYRPVAYSPEPGQTPALTAGHVTFGCFNDIAKYSDASLRLWAETLRRVASARLVLKTKALGRQPERRDLLQRFSKLGVDADRIDLLPADRDPRQHLARYRSIDIALDTFPYHGTTTTCDALWMSVPVVSLLGTMHVNRIGGALLHALQLDDLIASTPQHYVDSAVALANDPAHLNTLRSVIRPRMQAAALMDARAICGDLESAYRRMWKRYCAGLPAATDAPWPAKKPLVD